MPRRRLDNIRGSWITLVALGCAAAILGLGLGSERVRRVVRDHLPAALGGSTVRDATYWEEQAKTNPPPEEKKEEDPDALPDVPKEDAFRGIVRTSEGKPVPGATITAERWRESRWEVLATARANSRGEFVLGPVPRAYLSAVARAPGFASERKPARTGARLEFTLKKGGNLVGKVVDAADGAPVADCYLSGWSQRGDWYEQARTDKDGAFRFESVPPGSLWLQVVPHAYQPTNLGDLEIFEGKDTFKEIPVVKGGRLKGKVLDRETKVPVAGAKIRTWDGNKNAVSKEDGTYEILSPEMGGMSLKVSAAEYPEQWTWVQVQGDPTQDHERDLEIGKGGKVSGVVTKPDGSPAVGARVGRDPGALMTGVPEDTALTDAEGRFVLDAVPAWHGLRLFAWADGFALSRSDPVPIRSGAEIGGIRIVLQAGAVFKGTVKDEEGEPVAGVSLTFQRQWSGNDGGGWWWIPPIAAYSLADGTWELSNVPQGTYRVRATLEGYAPETRLNVNAPPEGEVPGQDFVMRKGSTITGRVRNRAGDLLPGVSVTAWGWVMGSEGRMEWVQRGEVRTDAEGLFVLDGLRDGTYQVNLSCTGYAPQEMSGIATGTRDLPITMLPNARVEGTVFESDGVTPVPSFTVRVFLEVDGDGNPQGAANQVQTQDFADREGKFSLKDVPEGQLALVAVSNNKISRRLGGIVVAAGGEVTGLRLQVAVGGRLRVVVRDAAGTVLKGANVNAGRFLADGSFQNEHWAQTDAEGVASFAAMADGTWTLWANYQGKVQESRTVSVGGGVEAEVDMVLRMGGSLLVRVTDTRGAAVADASVSIRDAAGNEVPVNWNAVWQEAQRRAGGWVDWNRVQHEATHTDAQGRLLRPGIRPGAATVHVSRQGYPAKSATFTVEDGFEIDAPVVLEAPPDPDASAGGGAPAPGTGSRE
jgi:protocatechuate 3,4-dioxygenase beta subunit